MPRARLHDTGGKSREWHSRTIARYQRRTARVDEAILGLYLAGANTRRVRGALAPLLRGAPMSTCRRPIRQQRSRALGWCVCAFHHL